MIPDGSVDGVAGRARALRPPGWKTKDCADSQPNLPPATQPSTTAVATEFAADSPTESSPAAQQNSAATRMVTSREPAANRVRSWRRCQVRSRRRSWPAARSSGSPQQPQPGATSSPPSSAQIQRTTTARSSSSTRDMGGEDPGAIGKRGLREAHRRSSEKAEAVTIMSEHARNADARDDDYFKAAHQRSPVAQSALDLFISIHADAFGNRGGGRACSRCPSGSHQRAAIARRAKTRRSDWRRQSRCRRSDPWGNTA